MKDSNLRLFVPTIFFILFLFANYSIAQQSPIKLYKHAQVLNTTVQGAENETDINAGETILIKAVGYNKTGSPSVLVASFSDEDGTELYTYPVAFFEKDESKTFSVYGPFFYEGRSRLNLSLNFFVFDQEHFQAIKGKFDTFFGLAEEASTLDIIPALGQATKFVDLGWKIAAQFNGNKSENLGTITISRANNEPLRTSSGWYLMGNEKGVEKLSAAIKTGLQIQTANELPSLNALSSGRAVVVSIKTQPRKITFQNISARLQKLLKKYNDRFDKNGLKVEDPFQGEAVQASLLIGLYLEKFLSQVAVSDANKTFGKPAEELISSFNDIQTGALGAEAFKFNAEQEESASKVITQLFHYSIGTTDVTKNEKGLATITGWRNWFISRCGQIADGKCTNPVKTIVFKTKNTKSLDSRHGLANDNYALNFIKVNLKETTSAKGSSVESQLNTGKNNLNNLRNIIQEVFFLSQDKPWMTYEQKSVATWLVDNVNVFKSMKPDLDTSNFQKVGEKFIEKLTPLTNQNTEFVLFPKPDATQNNLVKWELQTRPEYLASVFKANVIAAGKDAKIINKHNSIKYNYISYVVNPSNSTLTIDEAKSLSERLFTFPTIKDPSQKDMTLKIGNYEDYFKSTLLTIENISETEARIKEIDGARDVLSLVIKSTKTFDPDIDAVARDFTSGADDLYNKRRKDLSSLVSKIAADKDFLLNQSVIEFVTSKISDDSLIALKPDSNLKIDAWKLRFNQLIVLDKKDFKWDSENKKFIFGSANSDIKLLRQYLSTGCPNRQTEAEIQKCIFKPNFGGQTGEDWIKKLYEIFENPATSPQDKYSALEVITEFIDIPESKLDGQNDEEVKNILKNEYPVDKLEWKKGRFRLKESATANATPTPASTPEVAKID